MFDDWFIARSSTMSKPKPTRRTTAALPSIGGSSNEIGAHFRASVAAWVAAHGLVERGLSIPSDFANAIPSVVRLETGAELDDVGVMFADGRELHIQAKHSLQLAGSSKPMQAALKQWRAALSNPTLDGRRTRLVVVVSEASGSIRTLGAALDRAKRPYPGAETQAQADALSRMKALLNVSEQRFETFCKTAAIVVIPSTSSVGVEHVGIELLDGKVVARRQGAVAWRVLVDYARELARQRAGDSMPGWLDALRRHPENISLVADAKADLAARLEAERLAVERHRRRIVDRAALLDLRGLGVPLAPLPVAIDVDDICVVSQGQESKNADRELPVVRALRRRGRCLLLGSPGSGKSTALTQSAAAWAKHEDWPIPVQITLTAFLRALETRLPLDALLTAAMLDVPSADHVVLRSAFERAIANGNVALLLDGLDETRERRIEVVQKLDFLLRNDLTAAAEVVISTRDSAYAEAGTLGLKAVRIAPPRNVAWFVSVLLSAISERSEIENDGRENWIRLRETWVENVMTRDPTIAETPLMPLLLVLIAMDSTSDSLPHDRMAILNRIVDDVVRRWELRQRRTYHVRIGSLDGEAAAMALLQCFEQIGWNLVLEQNVRKPDAEATVASVFREQWNLSSGHATTTARDALHFWDEAGIFVFSGSDAAISARVTLLAEVGAARRLLSLPQELQRQAIDQLAGRRTARTALSLAMSLDASITGFLIQAAIGRSDVELLLWTAREAQAGAKLAGSDLILLTTSLLRRTPLTKNEAWENAKVLCKLPLSSEMEESLRTYLNALTSSQRAIAEAMLAVRTGRDIKDLDALFVAIDSDVRPGDADRSSGGGIVLREPDKDVEAFAIKLAEHLLIAHPDVAERVAAIARKTSSSTHERLFVLLEEAGRHDLSPEYRNSFVESMKRFAEDSEEFHRLWKRFLSAICDFAPPAALSLGQSRRLDELADYIATVEYGDSIPSDIWTASKNEPDFGWLLHTAAILGGFDTGILSAQAMLALKMEEGSSNAMGFLFDASSARELLDWNALSPFSQVTERLTRVVGSARWLADLAVQALEHTPFKREAASSLEQKLTGYHPYSRLHAGWLIVTLEPECADGRLKAWRDSSDPIRRRISAMFMAGTGSPDELAWAFNDPDDSVRREVARRIEKRSDVALFVEHLKELASSEPVGWLCLQCGTQNEVQTSAGGCRRCRTSPPESRRLAQKLLTQMGLEFKPPATPIARLLTRSDFRPSELA